MKKILFILLVVSACKPAEQRSEAIKVENTGQDFWYEQPLRIVQTVLREVDARDYDTEALREYLLETHANTLVINAGGIVDFFQNPLPAANLNPFLNGRDLLREIVNVCHQENIKVIGRIDFRGVEKHVYEEHPDWFGVNQDGSPMTLDYTTPELYAPCYLSYYRNEHAKEFIGYIIENYELDGIWHNSVHVRDLCYCERCRDSFREKTGKEIPAEDAPEGSLDEYYLWKEGIAEQYLKSMRETVKSYGEDKAYSAEVFGMFDVDLPKQSGIDLYSGARYFDFLLSVGFLSENTTEISYKDLGHPANHIRFLQSLEPGKQAVILFGTNGTSHRYIADPVEDLKIWMWETISMGGGLWNCNFTGANPASTLDRRNAFLTREPYAFIEKHREILRDQKAYAPIRILYSRDTRNLTGNEDRDPDDFGNAIMGIEKVLMEDHRPFGFLPDFRLDSAGLSGCELLILPDVACLSDRQLAVIRSYVKNGGKLLATYSTSLYDQDGQRREDFGLSALFGCSAEPGLFDTRKDSYQYIVHRNSLLEGFENTEMLMNGGKTLRCIQAGETSKVLTALVPQLNNQPPEKAWRDTLPINLPVMLSNVWGKGKVIYFANQPDRLSIHPGHNDFRALLKNSFKELQPLRWLSTNAPESVHINVTKSTDQKCYMVTLINLSSAPERPIRSLIPVRDVSIEINLPDGESYLSHEILRKESDVRISKKSRQKIEIELEELSEMVSFLISVE